MRASTVLLLTCLLCPALLAGAHAAETRKAKGSPDARVEAQLKALEYEYEIDEDGDFELVFEVSGPTKRSQLVYVRSPVETFGAYKVREVWSPGYKSESEQFPEKVANRLLESTQENKLGAWAKQGKYAVFVVKVDADASERALDDAIEAAIRSADEMEAELTPGKDEL